MALVFGVVRHRTYPYSQQKLMSSLSIHDLAIFTGGQLRLGVLPPLGGTMEPVRRICTDADKIQQGDIYWQLHQSAAVHTAFARGALGIVHEGPRIEPWAGRFSLQVRSAEHAMYLTATRSRRLYGGCLIVLLHCDQADDPCRTGRQFVQHLSQFSPLGKPHEPCDPLEMAREIIHLDERRPFSVFNLYRQTTEVRQRCLQRFGADVIVTSRDAAGGQLASKAKIIRTDNYDSLQEVAQAAFEAGQPKTNPTNKQTEPCVALPSMSGLRESDMPTLLGRSNKLADRWLLGRSPWRVLPGRA